MTRILFSTLMLVHGLMHLFGFAKQWELAEVSLLSGRSLIPVSEMTTRVLGAGWFVAYVLFMLGSLGYFRRRNWWMPVALAALILSQSLIIFYWPDAWAGTFVNILIALVLVTFYAKGHFDRQVDTEIQQLLSHSGAEGQPVTAERLAGLPRPVQKWLSASGVVGKIEVRTARLRQEANMHTSPIGYHVDIEAEQFIRVDHPGFVWKAELQSIPFLPITGRDKYLNGKGHMQIEALSLIPLVKASGPKIDQGTLLRFLGEICWVPSAALSPHITWRAIDDDTAEATMTYEGTTASATFTFDERNQLVSVSADRYMGGKKESKLTPWRVTCRVWQTIQGVKIPTQGHVTWKLPTRDWKYYDWEITAIAYDKNNYHLAKADTDNQTAAANRDPSPVGSS